MKQSCCSNGENHALWKDNPTSGVPSRSGAYSKRVRS